MSATRPACLRPTPRFDNSDIGMRWRPDRWTFQVVDLFCGRGGVGMALAGTPAPLDPWSYAGFDIENYSDVYPGRFGQADLLDDHDLRELADRVDQPAHPYPSSPRTDLSQPDADVHPRPTLTGLTGDVVWASFPCAAYSSLSPTYYGSREAALEANPRITDEFREFLLDIAPHYVIENVPRATKIGDLDANVRVNGLAFAPPDAPAEEKFDVTRHFETTFPCPDAYREPESDEEYITIGTRADDDQSVAALAEAKGVPAWGKQSVRSAIPWQYVYWILHHCPSVPGPAPKRVEQLLVPEMTNALGVDESAPWEAP